MADAARNTYGVQNASVNYKRDPDEASDRVRYQPPAGFRASAANTNAYPDTAKRYRDARAEYSSVERSQALYKKAASANTAPSEADVEQAEVVAQQQQAVQTQQSKKKSVASQAVVQGTSVVMGRFVIRLIFPFLYLWWWLPTWGIQVLGFAIAAGGSVLMQWVPFFGDVLEHGSVALGLSIMLIGWVGTVLVAFLMNHIIFIIKKTPIDRIILIDTLSMIPLLNIIPGCVYEFFTKRRDA